jgi:hypothetical protein
MHAWLERAVKCGATSAIAGGIECVRLCVRASGPFVCPLPDDNSFVCYDTGTDGGIRRGAADPALGEEERTSHPECVVYHFS